MGGHTALLVLLVISVIVLTVISIAICQLICPSSSPAVFEILTPNQLPFVHPVLENSFWKATVLLLFFLVVVFFTPIEMKELFRIFLLGHISSDSHQTYLPNTYMKSAITHKYLFLAFHPAPFHPLVAIQLWPHRNL